MISSGKKFTKTLVEKFGERGKIAEEGEKFFCDFYTSKGWIATRFEDDVYEQVIGCDVILRKGNECYSIDVKNNLKNENELIVECLPDGWLFNPIKKSMFISHVNPKLKQIISYRRERMKDYIISCCWDFRNEIIRLDPSKLSFVKWER